MQPYCIMMALLHRVSSLECNIFKQLPYKQTTMRTLKRRYKWYTALFSDNNVSIAGALNF